MNNIELINNCSSFIDSAIQIVTKSNQNEVYFRKIIRTMLLSNSIADTKMAVIVDVLFKKYEINEIAKIIEKKIIDDGIAPENILNTLVSERIITLEGE